MPVTIPIEISPIRAYQRCPRSFMYRYMQHLTPKTQGRPLKLGIELHRILESENTIGWDAAVQRLEEEAEQYSEAENNEWPDLVRDAKRIIRSYRSTYSDNSEWEVLSSEETVRGDFNGIPVKGRLDKLVRMNGRVGIVDHKSAQRIPETTVQLLDPQTALYAKLKRNQGVNVEFLMFDYLVTSPPSKPALVGLKDKAKKDGTFGPNKGPRLSSVDIKTDVWTVMDAIEEYGAEHPEISLERYDAYIKDLNIRPSPFFKRVILDLTDDLLTSAVTDVVAQHFLMVQGSQKIDVWPRAISPMTCPSCSYKHLCSFEHLGDLPSAEEERDTRFVEKPYWEGEDAS